MKPMLAATIEDVTAIRFPVFASPKLDGVRAIVTPGGVLKSRTLKPVPNVHVNRIFGTRELAGLDGELIYGSPTAKDVYRRTVSVTGSDDKEEGVEVNFFVFDSFTIPRESFKLRQRALQGKDGVVVVEQTLIATASKLEDFEAEMLEAGYEGLILRSPDGQYKFGRSTMREQGMMKLKRFSDREAEIIEVIEEESNQNEAKRNALGRTERSTAKSGMVLTGRAGALRVKDAGTGVEFQIGSGLTDADRELLWKNRKRVVGSLIKYKSFDVGVKDKPRHPVYLGPREKWDL